MFHKSDPFKGFFNVKNQRSFRFSINWIRLSISFLRRQRYKRAKNFHQSDTFEDFLVKCQELKEFHIFHY